MDAKSAGDLGLPTNSDSLDRKCPVYYTYWYHKVKDFPKGSVEAFKSLQEK